MEISLASTRGIGRTRMATVRKLVTTTPFYRHVFMLMPSTKVLIIGAGSVVAILLTGIFFHPVSAQSSSSAHPVSGAGAASGTVYLSAAGSAAAAAASDSAAAPAPMLEMHVANTGLALLRGARIVAVSGDTIHVAMSFGGVDFSWTLRTTSNTQFLTAAGEKETLADIQVGDIVTVTGMLVGGSAQPIIDAQFVRE